MKVATTLPLLGLALAGCTLGDASGGGGPGVDTDVRPEEAMCEAQLTLTGTLTPPGEPPTADVGCVPEGTWTVQVTVANVGDCGEVPISSTYVYEVVGAGRDRTITYTSPGGDDANVGIHAGGNGECEGSFEHIWAAEGGYAVMLLKPWFPPGTTTIQGTGTYQIWAERP